jgi:hypothetical protein
VGVETELLTLAQAPKCPWVSPQQGHCSQEITAESRAAKLVPAHHDSWVTFCDLLCPPEPSCSRSSEPTHGVLVGAHATSNPFTFYFIYLFNDELKTRSCYVTQPGLELPIVLPQPPECWDYRRAPPHLAYTLTFKVNHPWGSAYEKLLL